MAALRRVLGAAWWLTKHSAIVVAYVIAWALYLFVLGPLFGYRTDTSGD